MHWWKKKNLRSKLYITGFILLSVSELFFAWIFFNGKVLLLKVWPVKPRSSLENYSLGPHSRPGAPESAVIRGHVTVCEARVEVRWKICALVPARPRPCVPHLTPRDHILSASAAWVWNWILVPALPAPGSAEEELKSYTEGDFERDKSLCKCKGKFWVRILTFHTQPSLANLLHISYILSKASIHL